MGLGSPASQLPRCFQLAARFSTRKTNDPLWLWSVMSASASVMLWLDGDPEQGQDRASRGRGDQEHRLKELRKYLTDCYVSSNRSHVYFPSAHRSPRS